MSHYRPAAARKLVDDGITTLDGTYQRDEGGREGREGEGGRRRRREGEGRQGRSEGLGSYPAYVTKKLYYVRT